MKKHVQIRRLGRPSQIKVLQYEENQESVWVAGRRSKCDIFTGSKYASRIHFSIFYKDGKFFICDHGTANGTSLNNIRLTPEREYPLKLNDKINVGSTPSSLKKTDRDLFIFEICKDKKEKSRRSRSETLSNALEMKKKRKEDNLGAKEKNYSCKTKNKNVSDINPIVNEDTLQIPTNIDNIYAIDKFEKCSEVCLVKIEKSDIPETEPERSRCLKEVQLSSENNYNVSDIQSDVQVKHEIPDPVDCTGNNGNTVIISKEVERSDNFSNSDGPSENEFGSIRESLSNAEKSVNNEIIFDDPLPESEIQILYSHTYSNINEPIEISDSDDDTYQYLGIKTELDARDFTLKVEEDGSNDVVLVNSDIKSKKSNFANATEIKIDDDEDFSETDRKWIDKLLKKRECNSLNENREEKFMVSNEKEDEDESWIEYVMLCAEDINRILECEEKKADRLCDKNKDAVIVEDVIEIDNEDCGNIQAEIQKQKELTAVLPCERAWKRPAPESFGENIDEPVKKIKFEVEDKILKYEDGKSSRSCDEAKSDTVNVEDVIEIDDENSENIQTTIENQKEEKVIATKETNKSNLSNDTERNTSKVVFPDVARENDSKFFSNGVPCGLSKAARKAAKRRRARERKRERARLAICPAPLKQISNSSVELKIINNNLGPSISNNEGNKTNCDRKLKGDLSAKIVIRQGSKKPLKSSMKKFGCSFMRSNKPMVARKTVTFGGNQTIIYETENRISRVTSNLKSRNKKFSHKTTILKIISQICSWNAVWLEESKKAGLNELPEYFHTRQLKRVEKKYKNHLDYMATFVPLILLDLWYTMSENWQKFGSRMSQLPVLCKSYVELPQTTLGVLECLCVDLPQMPKDGDLIVITLRNMNMYPGDPRCGRSMLLFGIIYSRNVDSNSFYPTFDGPPMNRNSMKLLKLSILILQNLCVTEFLEQVIQITLLHNVSRELSACQAICDLNESPLCPAVLGPNVTNLNLNGLLIPDKINSRETLDFEQSLLITKIVSCCISKSHSLMLIQGSAGTGKTHMMKVLMIQLLSSFSSKGTKPPKIMYCSHSCFVVDEMALELEKYKQRLNHNERYNLVRFRDLEDMNSTVEGSSSYQMDFNLEEYAQLGKRTERIMPAKKALEDADIICVTCEGIESKMMIHTFKKLKSKNLDQKIICIIDGAMESKESESIMPLKLGVTHLILVGDPRQLQPKIKNEVTRAFGSHQSLFWRISSAFKTGEVCGSPVYVLKTQYRMSREIMKLISKIFYGVEFINGYADNLPRAFKEFLFFVDNAPTALITEEECDLRRTNITMMILDALMILKSEKRRNDSVAVITCWEDQTNVLRCKLNKRFSAEILKGIEVNPIEKVQGREFDIVLFLYDVNMETYYRANVAMSRAKRSLFVLSSPFYQKNKILKRLGHEAKHMNAFHIVSYNTDMNEIKSIINFQ